MKSQIQSLEVAYFVHATEDEARIEGAVLSQLGLPGEAGVDELEGHFGNRIVRVSHRVTGEDAGRAFAALVSRMSDDLKERLRDDIGRHLDEHSAFYVRLDKQGLLAGRMALNDSDPVRVRVKPRVYMVRGGAESFFRGLLS